MSLVVPASASAYEIWWRSTTILFEGSRDASASYSGFRASGATAQNYSRKILAGAHYPGGWDLYANYAEGWGYACHSYDGSRTLGALIKNPHTVIQNPVYGVLRAGGAAQAAC